MPITLQTNISALKTMRQLGRTSRELGQSFDRLASGLRITKASDDAAGLAIASNLDADSRIYTTAIRNANDGLSALNIAEGALNELSNIVTRIAELAEQSANGVITSTQRAALDQEAQALREEYQRIAETTEFNGLSLLNGQNSSVSLQVGLNSSADSQIAVEFGSAASRAVGDGTFQDAVSYSTTNDARVFSSGDIDGDGDIDIAVFGLGSLDIALNDGDGTFSTIINSASTGYISGELADFNGDGQLDIIGTSTVSVVYRVGNGDGTFGAVASVGVERAVEVGDVNGDGALDFTSTDPSAGEVKVYLNDGSGNFTEHSTYTGLSDPRSTQIFDANGDGVADLLVTSGSGPATILQGNNDGTFGTVLQSVSLSSGTAVPEVGDFNGDGITDLAFVFSSSGGIDVHLGNGDGTFGARSALDSSPPGSGQEIEVFDINDDGLDDIVATNGDGLQTFISQGDGSFSATSTITSPGSLEYIESGDFDGDGALDFVAEQNGSSAFNIFIANAEVAAGLSSFSLLTQAEARSALDEMKTTISELALSKGKIGASQSRVLTAIANNLSARENTEAAKSRILDIDVAEEAARSVRLNILQQAAAAVLGQANVQSEIALRLLE